MKKQLFFVLWGTMFLLCAVLGFVPEPEGVVRALLVCLAVLFFLPPGLLVYNSYLLRDRKTLRLLRIGSLVSLGTTLFLMVANLFSVLASAFVGDALYFLLVVLGCPLICGQYWFLGPGLWAVLLFTVLEVENQLKKEEKK